MSTKYEITALAYDKRGKLLSIGKNSYVKTHPIQAKYGKKAGMPSAIFLHAELSALLKARKKVHTLVVMRYDKRGNPAMAKPCNSCQLAIQDFGVVAVHYSKSTNSCN